MNYYLHTEDSKVFGAQPMGNRELLKKLGFKKKLPKEGDFLEWKYEVQGIKIKLLPHHEPKHPELWAKRPHRLFAVCPHPGCKMLAIPVGRLRQHARTHWSHLSVLEKAVVDHKRYLKEEHHAARGE